MNIDRESLIQRVKRHEGLRLTAYRCPAGSLSIGYGRKIEGHGGITEAEAAQMLVTDLFRAKAIAARMVGRAWPRLSHMRQEVLTEMAYQLGSAGLANFRLMLAAIEADDYETAADEMIDSRWHEQTPARCEELAAIMRTGQPSLSHPTSTGLAQLQ